MKLKTEELAGPRALGAAKMRAEELNTRLESREVSFLFKNSTVRINDAQWRKHVAHTVAVG